MKIKIDKLDVLFSQVIRGRAGGVCEYCGKPKRLECSHFVGRRKRATRWDTDNACGLCFSCHQYLDEHPYEHVAFWKKRIGSEKLEALVRKGNTIVKIDREEVGDMYRCRADDGLVFSAFADELARS